MGYEKHAEEAIGGRAFSVVALNTESGGIEEKRENGDQGRRCNVPSDDSDHLG